MIDDFTAYAMGVHDEREKWEKKIAAMRKEIGSLKCYGDGNYPLNRNLYIDGKAVLDIIEKYTKEQNNEP